MFWSALRRWGERAVAAGFLTIDAIKNCDPAACTLRSGSMSPLRVAEEQRTSGEAREPLPPISRLCSLKS